MNEFFQAVWTTTVEMAPWLLAGAIIAGLLHVVVPQRFMHRHFRGRAGIVKAVLFGIPLPLCSCGVIPAGIGLKRSGADDGAALGFIIATPQTGVDSVLVSAGMLGWPFALWKVLTALITGVIGGLWVQRGSSESEVNADGSEGVSESRGASAALSHALEVLETIYGWLFIGIVVSAGLTVLLPSGGLAQVGLDSPLLAVVAALGIGIPLYVCATASVPVAAALVAGGLPIGAALVFLMAGPATNAATIGAIQGAFGRRTMVRYLVTIVVGSVVFALLFDALFGGTVTAAAHHHHHVAWWEHGAAAVLLGLIAWFGAQDGFAAARRVTRRPTEAPSLRLEVEGMTCNGCVKKVRGALEGVNGVTSCDVDLESGSATVQGGSSAGLLAALSDAGFKARRSTSV